MYSFLSIFYFPFILSYFYHHSRRYTTRITVLSPFTFPICPCGHFYSNLSPFHSSLMGAFPRLSTPTTVNAHDCQRPPSRLCPSSLVSILQFLFLVHLLL